MKYQIAPKSTEIQSDWYEARLYCFSLNIDGKVGWRLPTKEELNEIYESENDVVGRGYWSSTEINNYTAWAQNMSSGYQGICGKDCGDVYVRAVRSIQ